MSQFKQADRSADQATTASPRPTSQRGGEGVDPIVADEQQKPRTKPTFKEFIRSLSAPLSTDSPR